MIRNRRRSTAVLREIWGLSWYDVARSPRLDAGTDGVFVDHAWLDGGSRGEGSEMKWAIDSLTCTESTMRFMNTLLRSVFRVSFLRVFRNGLRQGQIRMYSIGSGVFAPTSSKQRNVYTTTFDDFSKT
jgi:hypothetical protein